MKGIIKVSIIILLVHLVLLVTATYGQEKSFPALGKMMPAFAIKTDEKNKKESITADQLKGKYYILDFWNMGCVSCVASFPKMDSLQKKHKDNLSILLVGLEEKKRDARKFFEIYRKRFKLNINSLFDSTTFKQLVPAGVPHIIWVNRDGIVKAITTTTDVTDKNVEAFVAGKPFRFDDASYNSAIKTKNSYDEDKPFLIDGNGGKDTTYAFRSVIALWKPEMGMASFPNPYPRRFGDKARYQINGAPLEVLYDMAYFGTLEIRRELSNTFPFPELSKEATSLFEKRFANTKQRFSYSVELPFEIASKQSIMKKMQDDLSIYFGMKAEIVTKVKACYILNILDAKKFNASISGSGKSITTWNAEDTVNRLSNVTMKDFLEILPSKLFPFQDLYFIDETNIKTRVSFDLKAEIYDLQSIQHGLNQIGLDLSPTMREMRVLVISESHL